MTRRDLPNPNEGTCLTCGEPIANITTCTSPMERIWHHYGWQHEYDHLPRPEVLS